MFKIFGLPKPEKQLSNQICLPGVYLYKNTTSLLPSDVKSHIGTPFIHLNEIDSTNRYARNQIDANLAQHGTVYLAKHQTRGKGRQERSWISEPGKNILMSVVLNTAGHKNEEAPDLNRLIALGCFDLFHPYSGNETSIKWPNDIYWRDRKAGGILIENIWRGNHWSWSIIGIGLNINQVKFPEQAAKATSLKLITEQEFDVASLARQLCRLLEGRLCDWTREKAPRVLQEYNDRLYKKNCPVTLQVDNKNMVCTPLEVTATGELRVRNSDGIIINLREAKWID